MSLPGAVFREDPSLFDGSALDRRDSGYIRDLLPVMELFYRYYFRVSATGFENIPRTGPALVVGNHSGGIMTPDTAMTLHAWMTLHGVDAPVYGLVHPSIFHIPYLNVHTMKIGGIRAHPRQAMAALDAGGVVLVYPGGGDEAYRSYERRHEIDLLGRMGFVKLALRYRMPIVPLVAVGGHETLIVLDEGERLARWLGWDRRGVPRLPISLSWPWGLTVGFVYNVPFPARIDIEAGEPIRFDDVDPADVRDREVVRGCYERVRGRMQEMLDGMVAARR